MSWLQLSLDESIRQLDKRPQRFTPWRSLQIFQAKLLLCIDESGPEPAAFKELRSVTNLALHATKTTAQAVGRSMASLVVLERHLWLTPMEIKNADKVPFLDSPDSLTGLFGPVVEGFAERFTATQKSSQAMRHFLPKRSSLTAPSSRPKMAPTQQPAKPAPPAAQSASKPETRHRSCSARCYPLPKCQGARPQIALDLTPQASSWSAGQEEEVAEFHYSRTTPQAASVVPPSTPFSSGCRRQCVCCKHHWELWARSNSAHTTNRCYSEKNKTQTFSKREQISSSIYHERRVPARRPVAWTNPTPYHAGRGLTGHPRSVRLG